MKKAFRIVLVLALAVLCLTAVAAAADAPASGICDVKVEDAFSGKITLEAQKADGTPVATPTTQEEGKEVYADAVKVKLTYTGADSNAQYLVLALNDNTTVPTENNVAFIDQTNGNVTFDVYPKTLENGKTYNIYLSSDAASGDVTQMTKVGSFGYYAAYKLGDVNEDGEIDVKDVSRLVQAVVGNITLEGNSRLAGNVVVDEDIDVKDVTRLVNFVVGNITEF